MGELRDLDARGAKGVQVGDHGHQVNLDVRIDVAAREVRWPVQVGVPPVRARAFQERPGPWQAVTSGLAEQGALSGQVVVAGNGGVGKTQLAAAVFARARRHGVELLVWVNALSRDSMLATYAHALEMAAPDVAGGGSATDVAQRFMAWLATTSRSWLVVLDDVADPVDVTGLWPEGTAGQVLATTRRRDFAPGGSRRVLVGAFSSREASAYLVDRLAELDGRGGCRSVLDEADELVEDLGRLPVAVSQAAAVILNEGITCAGYRRRLADERGRLDQLFPTDVPADDYVHTVATTWSVALGRADRLAPAGLARTAMQIAAVVDPNGAPDTIWTSDAALELVRRQIDDDGISPDQVRTALRNLHRLSLVVHDPDAGVVAVRTHALTQRATLEVMSAPQRADLVRAIAHAVVEVWPPAEHDPDVSRALRQNAAALAGRDRDALWRPSVHPILFRAGQSLGDVGLLADAVAYSADLVAECTRLHGHDHPNTMAARHHLADWQGGTGDGPGAVGALRCLVADSARRLGADHPVSLAARHALAHWLGTTGFVLEAVGDLTDLVEDHCRLAGPDHPSALTVRHELAFWRGIAGDARGALEAMEALLVDSTRVLGADHPDTLADRQNLAYWLSMAGHPQGSVDAMRALVADRTRVLGNDHPDTLAGRLALAERLAAIGDHAEQIRIAERVLDDCLRVLGPNHPSPQLSVARHALAWAHGRGGDTTGAIALLEGLRDDQTRISGFDHPNTLATRTHLAWWRGWAGDAPDAVVAFDGFAQAREHLLGADHPYVLSARDGAASWRARNGGFPTATRLYEQLVPDYERVLGTAHPFTVTARRSLAVLRDPTATPQDLPNPALEPTAYIRIGISDWRSARVRRWSTRPHAAPRTAR